MCKICILSLRKLIVDVRINLSRNCLMTQTSWIVNYKRANIQGIYGNYYHLDSSYFPESVSLNLHHQIDSD